MYYIIKTIFNFYDIYINSNSYLYASIFTFVMILFEVIGSVLSFYKVDSILWTINLEIVSDISSEAISSGASKVGSSLDDNSLKENVKENVIKKRKFRMIYYGGL